MTSRAVCTIAVALILLSARGASADRCAKKTTKMAKTWLKHAAKTDVALVKATKAGKKAASGVVREGMALLKKMALRYKRTRSEDDLYPAQEVDRAITQLRVVDASAAAVAGWAAANQACNKVRVESGRSADRVCDREPRGKMRKLCAKCDALTQRMYQLARGTRAGSNQVGDLFDSMWQDTSDYAKSLGQEINWPGGTGGAGRRWLKTLGKSSKTLANAHRIAKTSEVAWEGVDAFGSGRISRRLLLRLANDPGSKRLSSKLRALAKDCR